MPDINPVSKEIISQKIPFAPEIGISKNVDAFLLLRAKSGIKRSSSETKLKLSGRAKSIQSRGSGVLMTSPLRRNQTFTNISKFQGTLASNHKLKESVGPPKTVSEKLQNIIFDVEAELEKLNRSEITEDEFQEEMYQHYVSQKKELEELRSQPVTIDLFN